MNTNATRENSDAATPVTPVVPTQDHLVLHHVSAGYGHVDVIHDIDITTARGSFGVLLGSNGAGKTTTLRAIMGLANVTKGDITLDGNSIVGRSTREIIRGGVALSPEGRQVFSSLTVEENLLTGCLSTSGRRHGRSLLDGVYEHFPILAKRAQQHSGTLSGGEQQMLAIARALMSEPSVLLVDEASLGLAPVMVEHLFELLAQVNTHGVTVLAVEQNVAVTHYADHVYVLEQGRITMGGPTSDVADQLERDIASAYLGRTSPTPDRTSDANPSADHHAVPQDHRGDPHE